MNNLPTDLEILHIIHDTYYTDFIRYSTDESIRDTKIYVPIDIDKIAKMLKVDGDIVFGRLYYHLNKKYGYTNDDGSKVLFFSPVIGKNKHCINFPYLSSVLANLNYTNKKYRTATIIAIISLLISISTFIALVYINQ